MFRQTQVSRQTLLMRHLMMLQRLETTLGYVTPTASHAHPPFWLMSIPFLFDAYVSLLSLCILHTSQLLMPYLVVQCVKLTQEDVSFRCVSFRFASQVRVSLPHLESILDYDENENDCNSSMASDNCTTGRTNTARAVIVMYAKSSQRAVFVCSLCSTHIHHLALVTHHALFSLSPLFTLHLVQRWLAVFSYHSPRAFAQPCSSHSLCPADMFNFPHAHSSLHTCLSQVQQWFAVPNLAR